MPRGVMTSGATAEEAEQSLAAEAPNIRILRSREIDLSGLPPLKSGPLQKHWVVVVEHIDPEVEATLPQHENPEEECERATRQMYLKMAIDPQLLSTGTIESADCPVCLQHIEVDLPKDRKRSDTEYARCSQCGQHLTRAKGAREWSAVKKPAVPSCMFCGAHANSKEHVIPRWISKQLGVKEELSSEEAFVMGGMTRRAQPISFASYRKRIFCDGCNRHFKHLEDQVIPLLVPMARGRSVSLDQVSQSLLSLWATKTAMALLFAAPELRDSVPVEHRRLVRSGRVPEESCSVLFNWSGGAVLSTGDGSVTSPNNKAGYTSYQAILAFAGLGFCVTGISSALGDREMLDGELDRTVQVHPHKHHLLHWPPPKVDNRIIRSLLSFAPVRRIP